MKRTLTTLLLAVVAATSFADEYVAPEPFVSSRSRADVIAEIHQARAAGVLSGDDVHYNQPAPVSTRSRAEVRAEFLADRELGAQLSSERGEAKGAAAASYASRLSGAPMDVQ